MNSIARGASPDVLSQLKLATGGSYFSQEVCIVIEKKSNNEKSPAVLTICLILNCITLITMTIISCILSKLSQK